MDKKMLLIDAYAQIFRGFHALPLMTNSKGEYTNAIFAFSRFLLQMERDASSEYGAVVFDKGRSTKRLEIHPEYKANRSPTPEELKEQLPGIRRMVEAFGFPVLEFEGVEADDLIAVLAANFTDFKVGVVSADKDLAQMIDERVEMLIPQGKGKGFSKMGVEGVVDKFGVRPDQIVDYLALIGDSSDNIPGVRGVGPKTAAKLLTEHGSIENMLANPEAIENERLRSKIADSAELLRKNIKLITLDSAPPDDSWTIIESVTRRPPDWRGIAEIAERYELKSFRRDLDAFVDGSGEKNDENGETDESESAGDMLQDDLFAAVTENPDSTTRPSEEESDDPEKAGALFTPDLFS
ncbi:MAG: 5'-3' exonuclease [Kiritimatiellaeota bacterium]|nr:5'-3' exonuclease [Kiritimatiellota bacterium]